MTKEKKEKKKDPAATHLRAPPFRLPRPKHFSASLIHASVAHPSFKEEPCHLQHLQAAPYAPPPPATNTTTLQTNDFLSQSPSSVRDTQSTFLANKRPLRTVTHWGKCVKESRFSIERGRSYILFVHSFIYLFLCESCRWLMSCLRDSVPRLNWRDQRKRL